MRFLQLFVLILCLHSFHAQADSGETDLAYVRSSLTPAPEDKLHHLDSVEFLPSEDLIVNASVYIAALDSIVGNDATRIHHVQIVQNGEKHICNAAVVRPASSPNPSIRIISIYDCDKPLIYMYKNPVSIDPVELHHGMPNPCFTEEDPCKLALEYRRRCYEEVGIPLNCPL